MDGWLSRNSNTFNRFSHFDLPTSVSRFISSDSVRSGPAPHYLLPQHSPSLRPCTARSPRHSCAYVYPS